MSQMLEIVSMLVLSTDHISSSTADWLDDEIDTESAPNLIVYHKGRYGWIIPITDRDLDESIIPSDILRLYQFAKEKNCTWLMLDCDANTVDGLPVYD